jgi:Fibronectin type III domain
VPSAPKGVSATPGDGSVALSWGAADGNGTTVASYSIRNLTTGLSNDAGSATSFTAVGLTNGLFYGFEVQAVGANGAVGPVAGSASVMPIGAPAAPSGIAAEATSPSSVTLNFDQVSPTNGTTVSQWMVTTNAVTGGTASYSARSMIFAGLKAATTYSFSVVAIGANGLSSAAVSATATTPIGVPSAVSGLKARSSSPRGVGINLTWFAASGADSYRIEVDGVVTQSGVTGTTASFSGGSYDNTGIVRVVPVNAFGDGAFMEVAWFTPPDPTGGCVPAPGKPGCIPP